jgi:hypothetical protein
VLTGRGSACCERRMSMSSSFSFAVAAQVLRRVRRTRQVCAGSNRGATTACRRTQHASEAELPDDTRCARETLSPC